MVVLLHLLIPTLAHFLLGKCRSLQHAPSANQPIHLVGVFTVQQTPHEGIRCCYLMACL